MRPYKSKTVILLLILLILSSFSFTLAAENKINMNFKGADIRDVLRTIAELADVNLVTDGSVNGNITIHLKNISFLDALNLITQTHSLAYKWAGNTVVVATPEKIEQIYTEMTIKTVTVKHAKLTEIKGILNQIYPNLSVTIDQRNESLIFRGKVEDIKEVERLLLKLDTKKNAIIEVISIPVGKTEFLRDYLQKVYPELVVESDENGNFVIYGSSYDIKSANILLNKLIEQLDKKELKNQMSSNLIESIRIKHVEADYISGQISKMYPEANIIADSLNNQIIYKGSNENFQIIKQLVSKIDLENINQVENEDYSEELVSIEYADLENIKTTLEGISPSLNTKVIAGTKQILIYGNKRYVQMALNIARSLDKEQQKFTKIVNIDYASLQDVEGIINDIYPEIGLKLNNQSKELVLNGTQKMLNQVLTFIEEVDVPRKQVIIEVRVEEVSTRDLNELGINTDKIFDIEIIGERDEDFRLSINDFLRMLESNGNSNTLANPHLMTLSGEEAKLLIGDRIPIQIREDDEIKIEYIEAGINLVFTPWVTKDNKINLKVNPQVSSIGESIGTAFPPINTREANTNIRLNDGESFAIGGLIQDDIIESVSKIPLLADIPLFGHLFRSRKVENFKTELIIFITPHIVKDEFSNKDNADNENRDCPEDTSIEKSILEEKESANQGLAEAKDANSQNNIAADNNKLNDNKNKEMEKVLNLISNKKNQEENSGRVFIGLTKEELNEILGINEESNRKGNRTSANQEREAESVLDELGNNDLKEDVNYSKENSNIKDSDNTAGTNKIEEKEYEDDIQEKQNHNSKVAVEALKQENKITAKNVLNKSETSNLYDQGLLTEEDETEINNESTILSDVDLKKQEMDFSEYHIFKYKLLTEITIRDLAEKFNVNEELILEFNKGLDASVGSFINIPLKKSRVYTIKKGDTLWKIHSLYGVDIIKLKDLNNIKDENGIAIGTEIVIPL